MSLALARLDTAVAIRLQPMAGCHGSIMRPGAPVPAVEWQVLHAPIAVVVIGVAITRSRPFATTLTLYGFAIPFRLA
jgi:hypothetical protein